VSDLRKALVRAAGMARGGAFLAAKCVEMEEQWIDMDRQWRINTWGDLPPARFRLVSVPRSLRRRFGRYVRTLP
jgi:hypothetical protein